MEKLNFFLGGQTRRPKIFCFASSRHDTKLFRQFPYGDMLRPAEYVLSRTVTEQLKYRVEPALVQEGIGQKLEWTLRFVPTNLNSALWLQLAWAIEGNKDYKQCEQCKRWFEVTGDIREGGKFCQNSCRSRAYRARQAEAQKLYSHGVTLDLISKQVGSTIEIVKGWVKKARSSRRSR